MQIKIKYVSNQPLLGDSPKVIIESDKKDIFKVDFIDQDNNEKTTKYTKSNELVTADRQWYTNWKINIYHNDNLIFTDRLNLTNKTVFIKIDAFALGDNIAWIPYIEEFRKKHKCNVICSTFHNHLFVNEYEDILFVVPNTHIENVYTQYYIGANDTLNKKYSPVKSTNVPLQRVASDTLGLKFKEVKPKIHIENKENNYIQKYVCISEFGSTEMKQWKGDWQKVVNHLNSMGYNVVVISKEKTNLKNVIDKSGDIPLQDRITDILNADFFMGISSGLAWLSWAIGTKVMMISDTTPLYHEFQSNIIRIGDENLKEVDYKNDFITPTEDVIKSLKFI